MKSKTRCNSCGATYYMSNEYIGRTARCNKCGKTFPMMPLPDESAQTDNLSSQTSFAAQGAFPGQNQNFPPMGQGGFPGQNQNFPPMGQGGFPGQNQNFPPMGQGGFPGQNQNFPPMGQGGFPGQNPNFPPMGQGGFPGQNNNLQNNGFGQMQPNMPSGQGTNQATQDFKCKKCGFLTQIPLISKTIKIACQQCGTKALVKPLPKSKQAKAANPKAKSTTGGSSKIILIIFLIILFAALILMGPKFIPGFPDLLPIL